MIRNILLSAVILAATTSISFAQPAPATNKGAAIGAEVGAVVGGAVDGTARAFDRAAGTNTSGAYPAQSDGMPGNPPGTVITRGADRVLGTNNTGTNPEPINPTPRRY